MAWWSSRYRFLMSFEISSSPLPQKKNGTLVDWNKINFPLTLAPMVGLSHIVLREIGRSYLPPEALTIWPTEMLNSRRVPSENLELTPETKRLAEEDYLVPQILGNEEIPILKSILRLKEWGAQGIDINMGCPVKKALRHNYGVALMGDRKYAQDVVRMAVKSSDLPVSVKLRAVESDNSLEDLYAFVAGLVDAGASWICLHPRTASQKRRGSADWEQIQFLKKRINVPLIGNGDVQTRDDVFEMKAQTGCDMVMSGRALAARPWLFWQVGEKLGMSAPQSDLVNGRSKAPVTREEEGAEYGRCLLQFIELSEKYFGENLAQRKVAFYLRTTTPWLEFGHTLIGLSAKAKNLTQFKEFVENFFSVPQVMYPKTNLRA